MRGLLAPVARSIRIVSVVLLLTGCAGMLQHQASRESARRDEQVQRLTKAGRFGEVRELWQATARSKRGSAEGEEAAYQAAMVLLHPDNPAPDRRTAAEELAALIDDYPRGARAADAAAWRSSLLSQEGTRLRELEEHAAALARDLAEMTSSLAKVEAVRAALEKDAEELRARVAKLTNERDDLARDRASLTKERDALARDKGALEKDLHSLTRERDRLLAAKAKLEKRLLDVTEVDIRMEKKRRNITK